MQQRAAIAEQACLLTAWFKAQKHMEIYRVVARVSRGHDGIIPKHIREKMNGEAMNLWAIRKAYRKLYK